MYWSHCCPLHRTTVQSPTRVAQPAGAKPGEEGANGSNVKLESSESTFLDATVVNSFVCGRLFGARPLSHLFQIRVTKTSKHATLVIFTLITAQPDRTPRT